MLVSLLGAFSLWQYVLIFAWGRGERERERERRERERERERRESWSREMKPSGENGTMCIFAIFYRVIAIKDTHTRN